MMSWSKHRDEKQNYGLSFSAELNDGEALDGTPTVTVTLNGVDRTSEVVEGGSPGQDGTNITFTAKTAAADDEQLEGTYVVKGVCATDSTPARTLVHTEELAITRTGDARA
jgi:hypothetical protein